MRYELILGLKSTNFFEIITLKISFQNTIKYTILIQAINY